MQHVRRVSLIALIALALGLASCVRRPVQLRTYELGEKVQVGHLVYSAYETQWMSQLGEGPDARVPQHRFFLVRIAVTNAGGELIGTPNLSVVDDRGNAYEELSNGDGVSQWIGFLRQIQPTDTDRGNLLFDVPPTHYHLRVTDETGEANALIDLPLDFTGNQAPDLTLPPADKQ